MPALRLFVVLGLLWSVPSVGVAQEPAVGVAQAPAVGVAQAPAAGVSKEPAVGVSKDYAAEAQPEGSTHTGFESLFKDLVGDFKALPSRENLGWTVFGSALALSVHPVDQSVNHHLLGHDAVHDFFLPGQVIGNALVQFAGSIGTYAYGRASGKPRVAHVGMDLLRAQLMAGALTFVLKEAVQRERPDGSNARSFPSGHASVTFATAIALQRHVGWKWSMPLFFVASYTAASRLHENVHYLSDVVAGATIGVIAGRTVTRHGRSVYALVPVWSHGEAALFVQRTF